MKNFAIIALLVLVGMSVNNVAFGIVTSQWVFEEAKNMDAFWDFNGSNPLLDKTGNGHNLTNSGATFIAPTPSTNGWLPDQLSGATVAGEVSRVANFGGGQYLAIPNSVYTGGSFTWIGAQRRTALDANYRTLLASSRFRYQNVNATLQGAINAPGGSFGGSTPLTNTDWYMIALTYDDTTKILKSYKVTNTGTFPLAASLTGSATAPGLGNSLNFRMGGDGTSAIGGFDGFSGQMDFAAWKNSVLTASQLQGMLNDFVTGPQLFSTPEPSSLMVWTTAGLCAMVYRRRNRGKSKSCPKRNCKTVR